MNYGQMYYGISLGCSALLIFTYLGTDCALAYQWSEEIQIAPSVSTPLSQKSLIDSNNTIHTVWIDEANGTWSLYYCSYNTITRSLMNYQRLTNDSTKIPVSTVNYASRPFDFTLDKNEKLNIAWLKNNGPQYTDIFYTKLNLDGSIIINEMLLVHSFVPVNSLVLACDNTLSIHLIWTNGSSPLQQSFLYYAEYDPEMKIIVNETNLTAILDTMHPGNFHQIFFPTTVFDAQNNLLITWEHGNIFFNVSSHNWMIHDDIIFDGEVALNKDNVLYIVQINEHKVFTSRIVLQYTIIEQNGSVSYKALATNGGLYPDMVIDRLSNAHIIWMDVLSSQEGRYPLYYSMINDNRTKDGYPLETSITGEIVSNSVPSNSRPSILINSHGTVYVVWTRDGSNPGIVMKSSINDISISLQNQPNTKDNTANHVSLSMLVKNNGSQSLFNVPVEISVNGKVAKQEFISEIGPGENAILNTSLQLAYGKSSITVSIDSTGLIPDINRANNQITLNMNYEKREGSPYIPSIIIAILGLLSLSLLWSGPKKKGS